MNEKTVFRPIVKMLMAFCLGILCATCTTSFGNAQSSNTVENPIVAIQPHTIVAETINSHDCEEK